MAAAAGGAERPTSSRFTTPSRTTRATNSGPDAPETKAAVRKVDALVGKLKAGLDATGLAD